MENYERYKNVTADSYEKKGVMYYLCQILSDKKIIPLLSKIENKKIIDIGCGSGYYTKFLKDIKIINLSSWLKILWVYMVITK